jgi:lysophospholipase L1-like esterase
VQPPIGNSLQPAGTGFENRTLRLILRPAIAGSRLRLRICNSYGKAPLTLAAVQIAARLSAAKIAPDRARIATFGGVRSVRIGVGESALSDPIAMPVKAGMDLAVDLYLPGSTGPPTWHMEANRTSYISSAGDHAGAAGWDGATATRSWFFLCGLDVTAPESARAVVALGDSVTDGARSTLDSAGDWPSVLSGRLAAAGRSDIAVINAGISGNRLLKDGTGESALARFDRDALDVASVRTVILLEGGNDIGSMPALMPPAVAAAGIIDGYRQLIRRAHDAGVRIIGGTLTPTGGSGYGTPRRQATRERVNDWLRSFAGQPDGFDAVIDFDAALRDPAHPERLRPAYDSGDHMHPSDTGYRAMAEAVDLALL